MLEMEWRNLLNNERLVSYNTTPPPPAHFFAWYILVEHKLISDNIRDSIVKNTCKFVATCHLSVYAPSSDITVLSLDWASMWHILKNNWSSGTIERFKKVCGGS